MKGYIKLHRKIALNKYYKKSQYIHLWLHLLIRASHNGSTWKFKGREYTIRPGQILCRMKGLSEQTGISEMQCYRIIKKFEKVKQISKKTYNKCSVIQILNYKNYQADEYKSKTKISKRLQFNNDNYKPLKPLKKFIS